MVAADACHDHDVPLGRVWLEELSAEAKPREVIGWIRIIATLDALPRAGAGPPDVPPGRRVPPVEKSRASLHVPANEPLFRRLSGHYPRVPAVFPML